MGTAAPGGGGGTNGDEVVEGEKLWSILWSSTKLMIISITYLRLGLAFVLCV